MSSDHMLRKEGRMTAPVIAVLDNDHSFISLMHDLLTDEGYLYTPLLWRERAGARIHSPLRRVHPALMILDLWLDERDEGRTFLKRLWATLKQRTSRW
jgi:CheY-like chemotaxis protein